MVDFNYISKIVRELELFFILENNNRLDGSTYSLILFVPLNRQEGRYKYNLILSAPQFDKYTRKEIISKIFGWLSNKITQKDLENIESVIVVNSSSPFIRSLDFIIPYKDGIKELDNISVGEVTIHHGILVFSNLLKKLKPGNAIRAELNDNRIINMGIYDIDENLNIYFYTGKGLMELFPNNQSDAEKTEADRIKAIGRDFLIANNYIDTININEISEVK